MLTSSNKSETAVHCCDPALSVLVMLVSRNVFHVVSALHTIVFIYIFLADQISFRSYVGSVFIVCGPLQFVLVFLKPCQILYICSCRRSLDQFTGVGVTFLILLNVVAYCEILLHLADNLILSCQKISDSNIGLLLIQMQ